MRRAVPALLLALVLSACGGGSAEPVAATGTAPSLADVPERARAAGTVRYEAVVERTRDGGPTEVEGRLSGVLDVAADSGQAQLDLTALAGLAEQADDGVLADVARARLTWTASDVTIRVGDSGGTVPRGSSGGGALVRVPEEPAGLLDVVAAARDVERRGREQVDGVATTRFSGALDPRSAVDAGLGTEAWEALAQLPALSLDVWLDDAGRPARIRYSGELPPSGPLPARTMTTTYDYRGWGEPVDLPD